LTLLTEIQKKMASGFQKKRSTTLYC
jgi:hypothetical protein